MPVRRVSTGENLGVCDALHSRLQEVVVGREEYRASERSERAAALRKQKALARVVRTVGVCHC